MHWLICRIQAKSSCILTLLYLPLKFPLEICISSLSCTTLSPLCRCPVKDDNCLSAAIRERSHFSSWKIWIGRGRNCFLTVAMWVRALLASFLNVQTEYSRLSYSTHTHIHTHISLFLYPYLPLWARHVCLCPSIRINIPSPTLCWVTLQLQLVVGSLCKPCHTSACAMTPPVLRLCLPACLRQRLIICSDNTLALTGAHRLR